MANYLTFASPEPFEISFSIGKRWDGTLYYSNNSTSWNEWDGTTTISSAEHGGEQKIYMRGSGNTVITGDSGGRGFVITGDSVRCVGNIENLLDYATVANGEHPEMGKECYRGLFGDCTSLITAPMLPATTLSGWCYCNMFQDCTNLTTAPVLPATTLAEGCYSNMFFRCTKLTTIPALPATTLAVGCYGGMFGFCESLTTIPALPATYLSGSCYANMFNGCTGIKISKTQTGEYDTEYRIPMSGTGTAESFALSQMFRATVAEDFLFSGTPSINTTYYTSNRVIASDEKTPEASVQYNDLTATSFTAHLFTQGLKDGKEYTAEFSLRPKEFNSEIPGVIYKDVTFTGEAEFSVHSCEFTDLLPNTTYTVNVDLYPSDGSEGIIACDCEVTTLEGEIPGGYDRDSFLLGFASGLGCTAATKDGAEYNSWAQGYIVGSALRKAL